jgi:hypothetical protein
MAPATPASAERCKPGLHEVKKLPRKPLDSHVPAVGTAIAFQERIDTFLTGVLMNIRKLAAAAAVAACMFGLQAASASVIVLNFAGLNGDAQENPLSYYAGGTGSLGSGPGPNYGITFSSNSIACSVQPGGSCNSAALPSGGNLLFFLSGGASVMDIAGGFDTGFSFYYSAAFNPAFVQVFSGLGGTGTLLATINLPATTDGAAIPGCFGTNFCPYSPIGVSFAGTAHSVAFGGSDNQVAFADITLGSATAGGDVPEPLTLALFGTGLAGLAAARRKKRN